MMARSVSPFSTCARLVGGTRLDKLEMGTFRGSSSDQFANSLLISPREPSLALIATARSSEPSPLKSPTAKFGLREASGVAAFSKIRATVSRISVGLGGADGLLAGVGAGVGEANASTRAAGSIVDSTRGAGSTLLTSSFRLAQPANKNAVASKIKLKPMAFVPLHDTRKPSLLANKKFLQDKSIEKGSVRLDTQIESSLTDQFVVWNRSQSYRI